MQETQRLLSTILSMQPWLASSAGGEGSGDQFVYDLAETMEGRIPTKIDMELAHKKLFQVRPALSALSVTPTALLIMALVVQGSATPAPPLAAASFVSATIGNAANSLAWYFHGTTRCCIRYSLYCPARFG